MNHTHLQDAADSFSKKMLIVTLVAKKRRQTKDKMARLEDNLIVLNVRTKVESNDSNAFKNESKKHLLVPNRMQRTVVIKLNLRFQVVICVLGSKAMRFRFLADRFLYL